MKFDTVMNWLREAVELSDPIYKKRKQLPRAKIKLD